jgi:hypothetical protein
MPRAPTIDNDVSAAVITLLCHLPEKFQGLWWKADEYCDMLRRGGLKDDVNVAMVQTAIRMDKNCTFSTNRFYSRHKYLIGDAIWPGFVPKDQEKYFKEPQNHYPRMQVDWFLKSRLAAVKSAVTSIASRCSQKPNKEAENGVTEAQEQHVTGLKLIAEHVMKCGSLFQLKILSHTTVAIIKNATWLTVAT